jgi:hypothetical protein
MGAAGPSGWSAWDDWGDVNANTEMGMEKREERVKEGVKEVVRRGLRIKEGQRGWVGGVYGRDGEGAERGEGMQRANGEQEGKFKVKGMGMREEDREKGSWVS